MSLESLMTGILCSMQSSEKQYNLWLCYSQWIGVTLDHVKAAQADEQSDGAVHLWYRKVAHRSHPEARRRYTNYLAAESDNSNH